MFTWEEAGLLRQMLWIIFWVVLACIIGAVAWFTLLAARR